MTSRNRAAGLMVAKSIKYKAISIPIMSGSRNIFSNAPKIKPAPIDLPLMKNRIFQLTVYGSRRLDGTVTAICRIRFCIHRLLLLSQFQFPVLLLQFMRGK